MGTTRHKRATAAPFLKRVKTEFTPAISVQGSRVDVRTKILPCPFTKRGDRGEIKEFSNGSRFRMLRLIAAIDWTKLPSGCFVTLTYPDHCIPMNCKIATMQRSHFLRRVETWGRQKYLGIWRHEFIDRKSGEFIGRHVGHWHISLFGSKLPNTDEVREMWRKELGGPIDLEVDSKPMSSGEHAAMYCAKYASKTASPLILDYCTYLTKPGRQWGVHRKKLFPLAPEYKVLSNGDTEFSEMVQAAKGIRGEAVNCNEHNFTLLGDKAREFLADYAEFFG